MIGLGVGIDYALFIVTRYQEHLARGESVASSVGAALDSAGRAVLFAGVTVVVSLLGMLLMGITFVTGLAIAASVTVMVTMVASVTLLPALIGLAGRRIQVTRRGGLLASGFVAIALLGVSLDVPILLLGVVLALRSAVLPRLCAPFHKTLTLSSDQPT